MPNIYLDHSATTPVDSRVAEIMQEHLLEKFGNPSSIHGFGRAAKASLEEARERVAAVLHCSSDEIYFTSGGTEADNIALIGYALQHREQGDHAVVSNVEHPAIRNSAAELERLGFSVTRVRADRKGKVPPGAVAEALTDRTTIASIMHVNNEVGTVNDVAAIGALLHERGVAFHTDAVQSFGKVPVDVDAMNIYLLSLSGHKIYGPKGIGALYVRRGVEVAPRIFGGHQESGVRAGTENLPGIVGLGMAAKICGEMIVREAERLTAIRNRLDESIRSRLPDVTLNGHSTDRLPGNLNLTFHGVEGEALMMALDLEGIAVSTGSACSSGSTHPSPVLTAIGLNDRDAQASIRFSLGRGNTEAEIDFTADAIVRIVGNLRAMAGDAVAV